MPVRDSGTATLTAPGPAAQAGHLGRGAGFVDEDKALGIEVRLACEPRAAPGCDVGAFLLGCVRRFF